MIRTKASFALVTLASLAALAAPGCEPEGPTGAEAVDAATRAVKAEAVPAIVAEGLALKHQIFAENLAVDEVKGLYVGSFAAEDVDGDPAIYLVFTSPSPEITSPFAYGLRLLKERGERDERDEGGEGGAGGEGDEGGEIEPPPEPGPGETSAAVGGATTRLQVSAAGRGLEWLVDFARTAQALGGEERIARVVAISSTAFLLEDVEGTYWDVSSARPAPREALEEKMAEARAAKKEVLSGELGQHLVKQWQVLAEGYDPAEMPPANEARDPNEFAGEDGHLDLAKVAGGLDLSLIRREVKLDEGSVPEGDREGAAPAPGLDPQARWVYTDACYSWWFFGWHTNCRTGEQGRFWYAPFSQAHRAIQRPRFAVPRCSFAGGGTAYYAYEGCGPAAFTSLVWRERQRGRFFAGVPPFKYTPANAYDARTYEADNAWGQDFETFMGNQVPGYMGSCETGGSGTLTMPWDVIGGGDRWLRDHGSGLRVGHRYTVFGANSFDAPAKASVLRSRLGYEAGPVVAAFDTGFLVAHYAPVNQYMIINPYPGNYWETTQVYVEGFDQGQSMGRWYAMHDPFALISGLFWLQ